MTYHARISQGCGTHQGEKSAHDRRPRARDTRVRRESTQHPPTRPGTLRTRRRGLPTAPLPTGRQHPRHTLHNHTLRTQDQPTPNHQPTQPATIGQPSAICSRLLVVALTGMNLHQCCRHQQRTWTYTPVPCKQRDQDPRKPGLPAGTHPCTTTRLTPRRSQALRFSGGQFGGTEYVPMVVWCRVMGRPRRGLERRVHVSLRLDPLLVEQADVVAARLGLSRTALVESGLEALLRGAVTAEPEIGRRVAGGQSELTRAADAKMSKRAARAVAGEPCSHPKSSERQKPWGVVCGDCQARLR